MPDISAPDTSAPDTSAPDAPAPAPAAADASAAEVPAPDTSAPDAPAPAPAAPARGRRRRPNSPPPPPSNPTIAPSPHEFLLRVQVAPTGRLVGTRDDLGAAVAESVNGRWARVSGTFVQLVVTDWSYLRRVPGSLAPPGTGGRDAR